MTIPRQSVGRSVIIPAAGLGTRLSPLTFGAAKELLPLGAYPALTASLLEAQAACAREVIIVSSADKPQLSRFFAELRTLGRFMESGVAPSASGAGLPAIRLAQLLVGMTVRLVEQPQPLGVLDAVARGLALTGMPCAVVFPDLIHLPDQTALARLFAAHAACGQAVIGLRCADPKATVGNTVAVTLAPEYASASAMQRAEATGTPLPIWSVGPPRGTPGELLTTFGQIHTKAFDDAIAACCRPRPDVPLADGGMMHALHRLARQGLLFGVLIPGEVIDVGSLGGYLEAAERFLSRRATFRGLP